MCPAETAELIEMPFGGDSDELKQPLGCLPRGKGSFWGCPVHSKPLQSMVFSGFNEKGEAEPI